MAIAVLDRPTGHPQPPAQKVKMLSMQPHIIRARRTHRLRHVEPLENRRMLTVIPGSLDNDTTISIGDIQDATIYQNNPNNSSGQGPGLFSGTNGMDSPRRGLLQFDIADNIPHGATITGVQLTLVLGQIAGGGMGGGGGTSIIQLHDLTDSWGYPQPQLPPSDNLGGTGQGIPAMTGDVTWDTRFFNESPALPWSSPGGDFSGVVSASLPVTGPLNTSWDWSSPTMVNDVQGWLNDPSTDFGWILVNADEVDPTDFRAFYSRNALTPSNQPLLTITYIPADSPPVVQLNAPNANYATTWNNSGAVAIASSANASVTDAESSTLNAMTITLASPQPGDVLSATPTGSVTVTAYNPSTGVLLLSGPDTLADYQQVLGTVKYNNTTGSPGIATETVSVVATDSLHSSTAAVATININVTTTASSVSAVKLFYDNSKFNKNVEGVGTGTNDDKAIDTTKTAYLPGAGTANFSNISSYTDGINGIMVDLATGGAHGNLNASDFTFRVGINNSPSLWASAPTPSTISVRTGSPAAGNDRVELTWTDGSIKQEWLEVTVHADPNTGLSAPYTFFYGSVIANTGTGDSGSLAITSSTDENAARSHGGTATVTNIYDFNKDGFVNSSDENAARGNGATVKFIKIAANTPLAPDAFPSVAPDLSVAPAVSAAPASSGGDTGLASGPTSLLNSLKTGTLPPLRLDWLASQLENVNLNSGVAATIFEALAVADTKLTRSILTEADKVADQLGLDDTLLDSILVDLGLE